VNPTTNELRICNWCDSMFVAVQYAQRFCSYVCGYTSNNARRNVRKPRIVDNCVRCGADLSDKRANAIYCSKTCKCMDHTFKHRARTRTAGTARRRSIIERDGSACYICGAVLASDKVELDHLLPVARGGSSLPENLSVSCGPCNRRKGTQFGLAQYDQLLKNWGAA
jgi:hypothetical protein